MKQPITNTLKHFLVPFIICLTAGFLHWLINRLPNTQAYLWWWGVFLGVILILNTERNQYIASNLSLKEYLRSRWLDTILDILAGLLGMSLGLLPFWYLAGF